MAQIPLDITLVAPIPVGHRVRVRFYVCESHGLFGSSKEEYPHEPVIEDLDTGIVYCSERPFAHGSAKYPKQPLPVESVPAGTIDHVIEGKVRACRVITLRAFGEADVQTHLLIET